MATIGQNIFCVSDVKIFLARLGQNIHLYLLDSVVLLHVPSVLLCFLVEEHQPLSVGSIGIQVLLSGQHEVGVSRKKDIALYI